MNTFDEYQRSTHTTAIYPPDKALEYLALGLVGEAGEVAQRIKKYLRDGGDLGDVQHDLYYELGDVLWYLSELCTATNAYLSDVAAANLAKLADRQARGVLGGSGDKR